MPPVKPLLEVAEGKLRVNFHPGQLRAWDSTKRTVAVIAGGRSGKTSFAPLWLHREMQRKGPGDYLVAGPNFPLIDKAAAPEVEHLFSHVLRLGRLSRSKPPEFVFSADGAARLWGRKPERSARILFGHAEDPQSLEAMGVKAAWLDEAGQNRFRLASYEAVQQRLSIDKGRLLITSKPFNLGWLKQKVYDPWLASGRNHPDIDVVNFASTENPAFPAAEMQAARARLPRWKFDMQYLGLFTWPAGLIYDSFDPQKHCVRRFPVPANWPRYLGLDFGPTNTAATFWAAEVAANRKETGKLYLYRTYHPGKRTPEEHVRAILAGEPGVPTAVGGAASEDGWREDFGAAGLAVLKPELRDVEVGIDRVYAAHSRGQLVVFDDLEEYLDEKLTYSRELNVDGEPTEKIEAKASFHLLDSERYIVGWLKANDSAPFDATPDPSARIEVARAPAGVFDTDRLAREAGGDSRRPRDEGGEVGHGDIGWGGGLNIPEAW